MIMNIKTVLHSLFSDHHAYEPSVLNSMCSEFEVNNWTISKFVLHELVPIVDVHPFPLNELMLMASAVCKVQPSHIFEWGTNIGKSARIFYETIKAFNISAEIHSIDLPDDVEHIEHPKGSRGFLVRGLKEVTLHVGDGLTTSLQILSRSNAVRRTLFFIDGDHSYASVRRELEGIIRQVPHANIMLHDTFYQAEDSGYNIGPYKAITDVLAAMPDQYKIVSQNLGLPGITLLWNKQ